MAYGLSLDLLFFDDANSDPAYSMLDDLEEFEPGGNGLYYSGVDGTTAAKSIFSDVVMANVYSFHIPGDAAGLVGDTAARQHWPKHDPLGHGRG